MRAIYVIGPSSTGKTTLCDALSKKLALPKHAYVTEIARQVMKTKGYSRDTIGSLQMQQDIMDAHFQREDALDTLDCPVRLFDRSAIDPIVYAILTSKTQEEATMKKAHLTQSEKFQQTLQKYRSNKTIVLLLKPVPEWLVDDGVRVMEKQEEALDIFRGLAKEFGIHCYEFGHEMKFLEERVIVTIGLGRF